MRQLGEKHTSSPLPLCHIRPPSFPVPRVLTVLSQATLFLGYVLVLIDEHHDGIRCMLSSLKRMKKTSSKTANEEEQREKVWEFEISSGRETERKSLIRDDAGRGEPG